MMAILANPSPIFQPALRIINAITNSNPAAVTTSFDHDYITGEIVRLYVPSNFGMTQINKLVGTIDVTGSDTFTIDIDSTQFDIFSVPTVHKQQYAQVAPIGEINSILTAATRNTL